MPTLVKNELNVYESAEARFEEAATSWVWKTGFTVI